MDDPPAAVWDLGHSPSCPAPPTFTCHPREAQTSGLQLAVMIPPQGAVHWNQNLLQAGINAEAAERLF